MILLRPYPKRLKELYANKVTILSDKENYDVFQKDGLPCLSQNNRNIGQIIDTQTMVAKDVTYQLYYSGMTKITRKNTFFLVFDSKSRDGIFAEAYKLYFESSLIGYLAGRWKPWPFNKGNYLSLSVEVEFEEELLLLVILLHLYSDEYNRDRG